MRSQVREDGTLEVFLQGFIDSANSGAFEAEANALLEETNATSLTIDCTDLEYISSAGLRVLVELVRRLRSLRVKNVSLDIYEIFEVSGLTELFDVQKALREVDVSGLELLGEGANGSVYRLSRDEMIKVYRPEFTLDDIESERQVSRRAFLLGVPCAISLNTVRCGDGYGTVFELLDAVTLSERIAADPSTVEECAVESAKMFRRLHEIEVTTDELPDAMRSYYGYLNRVAGDFTDGENERLHGLLDAVPPMDRFTHNDYHPKNVMYSNGELMIIDLGDAGSGNPLLDWMHTYSVFHLLGAGMGEHADDELSFIGITFGDMRRFWKVFTETYLGGADRAERMSRLLEPWGWLVYLSASLSHPLLPQEYRGVYVRLMREKVLGHANEMVGSLAEMGCLMP